MAAAYAAITSLMNLLTQIREHQHPPIQLDDEHVDSLNSKISFFQRFLEDHHSTVDHGLELRIADAAHAAEDLIETHIADHQNDFSGSLQRVIQGMDIDQVPKRNWTEQSRGNNQPRRHHASSQTPSATSDEVGIEDATTKVVDKLTQNRRQIISITGMGGIGKTTLASKVYNHPYVKNYFDICAWATISKDYNKRESLAELLHCLDKTKSKESLRKRDEYSLGEQLYKYLIGRRYLVMLDDVWDVDTWDRLRSFFPASSGSGIVITTRESSVASIGSYSLGIDLLDERKTWDLFCNKVFGQGSCPSDLEDVGKKIAKKCGGLPLSIVVIGSHLAKSPRTQEYWEYISKNLSSVVNAEDNDRCLKILSLSYTHLPVHLKPCFLYLGIFPEDREIWVSDIIRLWMVEGILKPINGKSPEDAAEEYLNDLISRNLVLASMSSTTGKTRRCKMHDLLRDLCLRKEKENSFFRIVQKQTLSVHETINGLQISHRSSFCGLHLRIRTLAVRGESDSESHRLLEHLPLGGGSLTISENRTIEYPDLVNLQCLTVTLHNRSKIHLTIPRSICFLWNLQSLVIDVYAETKAPPEIWKMSQLRHIEMYNLCLPNPPGESNDILKNLQSAGTILNFGFSEDLVRRIPNIKTLAVRYELDNELEGFNEVGVENISRLEKLESFNCIFYYYKRRLPPNPTFPHSLKELTFGKLPWDDVTTKIGSLPLLEVLKLSDCSGREWKLVEGQFIRLKFLTLDYCRDLECFTADNNHFPCLQDLLLYDMGSLKEISFDIGDISTLRLIWLVSCPQSVVVSAKEIAEYQYQMGNEGLQVKALLCC